MDPTSSSRALFPADPHAAADCCPPWLADRLEDLLQEMETLNTWFAPASVPTTTNSSPSQPDAPDLYCGDAQPCYYTPRFRDLKSE